METGDPADFLTLLLLLGHPKVNLKAVTIARGTAAQVGLVRRALSWFGRDLPADAFDLDYPKDCVSTWQYPPTPTLRPRATQNPLLMCCSGNVTSEPSW